VSGTFTVDTLPGLKMECTRTPVYATLIQTSSSGKEGRAVFQSTPRYKFSLAFEFLRSPARGGIYTTEAQALVDFFDLQKGRFDTFTFYDPLLVETYGRSGTAGAGGSGRTCRFDSDEVKFQRFNTGFWQVAAVDLISVK
jgi:hypothetical protein